LEFHHDRVFKARKEHGGSSNPNRTQREQEEQSKREPEKEEKTRSTIQTKKKNKKKTLISKMLSIVKVASFLLLASQGVTCSESADEGPIIGKSSNFSSMLLLISHY